MTRRPTDTEFAEFVSRRGLIGAAGGLAAFAATVRPAEAQSPTVSVPPSGRPATVSLKEDVIDYALVQHPVLPVDPNAPRQGIRENLARMAQLLDEAANMGPMPDLISFHEFPIAGYAFWTRKEMLAVSIDIPGEETRFLAEKAKQLGVWLTFGCYARDKDWPDHVLMLGVLMNPAGEVVAKHWKARGSHGRGGPELITSTVYDVLPRYVEMYGWDEVVPVARTPVGNISITGVQYDPMLFTAMAIKGTEISIRQATGSNPEDDARITSKYHGIYTGLVSNSVSPGNRYFPDFAGAYGITQIVGPGGAPLAKAYGSHEEIVRAALPLAQYRKTHLIPDIQWDLYAPIFAAYQARYAPGHYLDYLPPTMQDAAQYFRDEGRWG